MSRCSFNFFKGINSRYSVSFAEIQVEVKPRSGRRSSSNVVKISVLILFHQYGQVHVDINLGDIALSLLRLYN